MPAYININKNHRYYTTCYNNENMKNTNEHKHLTAIESKYLALQKSCYLLFCKCQTPTTT